MAELWRWLTWARLSSEACSWQEGPAGSAASAPTGRLDHTAKRHRQVHDPGGFSSCESCAFLRLIPRYSLLVLVFVN